MRRKLRIAGTYGILGALLNAQSLNSGADPQHDRDTLGAPARPRPRAEGGSRGQYQMRPVHERGEREAYGVSNIGACGLLWQRFAAYKQRCNRASPENSYDQRRSVQGSAKNNGA